MVRKQKKSNTLFQSDFTKKAFIFTFMSFFFVASIYLYVQTQQLESRTDQVDAETLRVERVSQYVRSLEEDYLPLIAKSTATKAVRDIVNKSISSQIPLSSEKAISDDAFFELAQGREPKTDFFKNISNPPLIYWDFVGIWGYRVDTSLPCLLFESGCASVSTPGSVILTPPFSSPGFVDFDIVDCAQLQSIAQDPTLLNVNIILMDNIDCSNIQNFLPIGNRSDKPFTGAVYGNGYSIHGVRITEATSLNTGSNALDSFALFGYTNGAHFYDLDIHSVTIKTSSDDVESMGVLIGNAKNTVISNVAVRDSQISGSAKAIGGIVGEMRESSSYILNSYFDGDILVSADDEGEDSSIGGIAGIYDGNLIMNVFTAGRLKLPRNTNAEFGPLVGELRGSSSNLVIKDSFSLMTDAVGNPLVSNLDPTKIRGVYGVGEYTGVTIHSGACVSPSSSYCEIQPEKPTDTLSLDGLVNLLDDATQELLEVPFELDYTDRFFEISQVDPWNIRVTIYFVFSVNDDTSSWRDITKKIEIDVPIVGLPDPLLSFSGIDTVPRISRSSIAPGNWSLAKLRTSLTETTTADLGSVPVYNYVANPDAPSYLDRLQNKTGSSPYGIELVMLPSRFGNPVVFDKPYVDYLFVRGWNCTTKPLYENTTMLGGTGFDHFRLDDFHALYYSNNTDTFLQADCMS